MCEQIENNLGCGWILSME